MSKGQIEYAAVVVVAIIGVVVALYAVRGDIGTVVFGGNEDYKVARASVSTFIESSAYQTARWIAANGGHAVAQDSVTFLGASVSRGVPASITDVSKNFASVMNGYLADGKQRVESSLRNSSVKLGTHSLSANVMETKIVIRVEMPVAVGNQSYNETFNIEIPSKLGRMYTWVKDFSAANAQKHFFESYTMAAIASSPEENGFSKLPLFIFLTECGQSYEKSWSELRSDMNALVKETVYHTYYGKMPNATKGSSYLLPAIGGTRYTDLHASFGLPDGFAFNSKTFGVSPSPVVAEAEDVNGFCFSNPVHVSYAVAYPVIVAVSDGNMAWLFAMDVAVNNSGTSGLATNTDANSVCETKRCVANVTVKAGGKAVAGAKLSFMGCPLGVTDGLGSLIALAPCGDGELKVRKDGYALYSASTNALDGLEVTLKRTATIQLKLYEVPVNENGGKYIIVKDAPVPSGKTADIFFTGEDSVQRTFFGPDGTAIVPEGKYSIAAQLSEGATPVGGFIARFYSISGDATLHVYIPSIEGYAKLSDNDKIKKLAGLTGAMERCLGTVSDKALTLSQNCEDDVNG